MPKYILHPAKSCATCLHFRRHYVRRDKDWFMPLDYGHCVYPRLKKREPNQSCPRWTPGPNRK